MLAVQAALTDLGFQPQLTQPQLDAELSLRNCPFHTVAQRQPGLICGLNAAFVDGLLVGLEATGLQARLQPETGSCCVRVAPLPVS